MGIGLAETTPNAFWRFARLRQGSKMLTTGPLHPKKAGLMLYDRLLSATE